MGTGGMALPAANLAQDVADILRKMFLAGELEPGQRIIESELAERLNVSRGPVREAMRLLEQEGILTIVPRRGTFVMQLSAEDLYDIYTLRGVLEGLGARILAERADPAVLSHLRTYIRKLDVSKDDLREFAKLDLEFHGELCRLTGHRWLYKQWSSMRTYIWLFIRASQILDAPGYQQMVEMHVEIVEVMAAGLPTLAEMTVRNHSAIAGEKLRLLWRKSSKENRPPLSMLQKNLQLTQEGAAAAQG